MMDDVCCYSCSRSRFARTCVCENGRCNDAYYPFAEKHNADMFMAVLISL